MEENENFIHNKYGYCYYTIYEDSAIIFNLYVEPEYRRKGYARKLINYIIKEIRKTGYDKEIQIEVDPREDSISVKSLTTFYEGMELKIYERVINND
jgi:GNAT superfamily N-acetyltransferase